MRFAQALARLFRQVVADHVRRLLAVVRAAVREVRGEVRLAQVAAVDEQVHVLGVDRHRLNLDVGHDADALDRDVARREVLRDGELERPAVVVVAIQDLDRALAERALADDQRAVVVLERAGDDLAGRGAAAVLQHDHRVVRLGAFGARQLALGLLRIVRRRGHDRAARQEDVGDAHRLLQQAARVVAQVEHDALQVLLVQLGQRRLDVVAGVALEIRHAHVADAVGEHARLDRLDVDHGAREIEALGFGPALGALAHDPDRDVAAGRAAQPAHRFFERHVHAWTLRRS